MCNPNTLQSDLNSLQCERLNTSLCNVLHKRITEWSKHITASSKHITERSKYIIARFKQLTARSKHLSVQSNCCHLGAFCVHHTTMHRCHFTQSHRGPGHFWYPQALSRADLRICISSAPSPWAASTRKERKEMNFSPKYVFLPVFFPFSSS